MSGMVVELTGASKESMIANINNLNNNNNNNNNQQQQPPQHDANNNNNNTNAAILARLKEVEHANQQMLQNMDNLKQEIKNKDDNIQQLQLTNKELSADKRKDMEQIVETAIDEWLNSLTGISPDVRKQFREGVTKLAEHADMKNNAWEVVCNASKAHKENVNTIEQLRRDINDKDKTIETLLTSHSDPTFASEASRIDGGSNKRQRPAEVHATTRQDSTASTAPSIGDNNGGRGGDAWQDFARMLSDSGKNTYY
jgi:hypothetical protein